MGSTPADRQERRHRARQRSILHAAAEEFARTGYERTTLERIGDRVGLSKASLYYYVEGKEQILAQLLENVVDDILRRIGDRSDPAEALHRLIAAHVELATASAAGKVLVHNLDTVVGSKASAAARQRYMAAIAAIVEDGVARGDFVRVSPRVAVQFIIGALNAACRWSPPEDGDDVRSLVAQVRRLVFAGIGAGS